jgi:DNA (cytosine-5)-methyltransferase 1
VGEERPVSLTAQPDLWGAVPPEQGVAISLFSGAGGLDLGIEEAGFSIGAAVELDEDAADTMEKNFHGLVSPVIRRDLFQVPTAEILRAAGLRRRERPDLLVGSPPCVAFSKSGFWLPWKRRGADPAADLLDAYTRVLAEARPRAFILENVYALVYRNRASQPAFERLLRLIRDAGYSYQWRVLNSADYGVPQLRPRLFVVGARRGLPLPELPSPTHGGQWERRFTGNPERPHVTAAQALEGLRCDPEPTEIVNGTWGHLLPEVPPGDNYLYFTAERENSSPIFRWRSRYWNFLLKLHPDRPSPTIQAKPGPYVGPFHWESRRLRVPELKRLFTFPDDFAFVGSRSSVQRQLGNAVPPLLAMHVARMVAQSLQ